MPDSSEANIATADALTFLLQNQHALAAAVEEVTKFLSENGVGSVAANALSVMETLDANGQAITDAIMRLRQAEASNCSLWPRSLHVNDLGAGLVFF